MPRITNPENFPQAYFNILQTVGAEGHVYRVPATGSMPDSVDSQTGEQISGYKRLSKLRGHFYAFKGSLKRVSKDEKWKDVYVMSCRVAVYLDKANCCIEFRPTDKSWHAEALATGGIVGEAEPLDSADDSLKKLLGDLP